MHAAAQTRPTSLIRWERPQVLTVTVSGSASALQQDYGTDDNVMQPVSEVTSANRLILINVFTVHFFFLLCNKSSNTLSSLIYKSVHLFNFTIK